MRLSSGDRFLATLIFTGVAALFVLFAVLLVGCDGGTGSLIGLGGAGGDAFDVCAVEGVEQCCFECETCPKPAACNEDAAFEAGYVTGFEEAQKSCRHGQYHAPKHHKHTKACKGHKGHPR